MALRYRYRQKGNPISSHRAQRILCDGPMPRAGLCAKRILQSVARRKGKQYAQLLSSDDGRHNGLFWKTADGEAESPIGPLLAYATGPGNGKQEGENSPFHGYYFRILTGEGKTAQADAKSYIVNGEMIAGFAFLAYPADYRSSGVMTFIVNQTGVVYQKDLGDKTAEVASAMMEYAPDETWKKAE